MQKTIILILLSLMMISCGGNSDESIDMSNDSDIPSNTINVEYYSVNIQTNTKYKIDITNLETLGENREIKLSLLDEQGQIPANYSIEHSVVREQNKITINYSLTKNNNILEKNLPLVINLVIGDLLPIEQKVFVWDLPEVLQLNMPQRGALISDKSINELGSDGAIYFYWVNLPPWIPPTDLNWDEDPFSNISWKLYFHSLGWLTSYYELYERTKNSKLLSLINNYLKDYNETFPDPFSPSISLAYREDSVSLRLNNLLYLYLKYYRDLPKAQSEVIENLIEKDIKLLHKYIKDESWDDKNHGLIQAKTALNVIVTFPFHPDIHGLEVSTDRRITALSDKLFSKEGYVVEQATGYHFIGLAMMLEAKLQLESYNMPPNLFLLTKIRQALEIAPYLMYHDGTTPAIGDTSYGKDWRGYLKRYYSEYGQKIDQLEQFFNSGHEKLDNLKVIRDEGVVIAKFIPTDEKMSKVFFDVGSKRHVHGHYDQLSIVASLSGEPFLVDSGGPYTYSAAGGRDYWRTRSNHNTLMAKNDEKGDYSADLVDSHNNTDLISASGTVELTDGVVHNRGFILTKDTLPLLIVIDSVDKTSSKIDIEEFWHFAPDTVVTKISPIQNSITVESGTVFNQYTFNSGKEVCNVVEGEVDYKGNLSLGWVTPKYNVAERSPVVNCKTNVNQYLKVNVFTEELLVVTPKIVINSNSVIVIIGERQFVYSLADSKFVFKS